MLIRWMSRVLHIKQCKRNQFHYILFFDVKYEVNDINNSSINTVVFCIKKFYWIWRREKGMKKSGSGGPTIVSDSRLEEQRFAACQNSPKRGGAIYVPMHWMNVPTTWKSARSMEIDDISDLVSTPAFYFKLRGPVLMSWEGRWNDIKGCIQLNLLMKG